MLLSITGFDDAGEHIAFSDGFRTVDKLPFHLENSRYYIDNQLISPQKIHFWKPK